MDDETNQTKHFEDEFEERISRYFVRNIFRVIGYVGYVAGIMGGIFFYQAKIDHARFDEKFVELERVINSRTGETELITTDLRLIEKHLLGQLSEAKANNEKKTADELQELLKLLQENKLRKKNNEQEK